MALRKLLAFIVLFAGLLTPAIAFAQLTTVQGGTGTTSPSGILIGVTGNLHLQTLTVGTGLTLTGTTLTSTGGGGTPGGLNTQIQYNNNGSFGGISGAVTDGTAVSLTAAHLLNPTINGAGTGLATLTYPNTSTSVTITFPATTNTLATLAGAEALTNKSVNGVTLTTGGSATAYLNGTGSYTVPAGSVYTGTYPILVTGSVISTAFGTTTNWGIGNNGFLVTGATGIPFVAASSTLNLPNTALQNSSLTVNGSSISLGGSATVTANTTNALTFNNSGSGAASGSTFNGSGAVTVSYNTIGAQVAGTYVTSVAVASSNGFTGSSSGGATPTITLTTSVTSNVLKGNGTAIVGAANGTDYTLLSAQSCSAGSFVSALTAAGGSTCTAASTGSAYPFTPSTFGIAVSATSTPILDYPGLIAATSTIGVLTASSSIIDQLLATPAGTFVAADPTGKLIATSTPSGSNSAFSPAANYATVAGLPGYTYVAGVITETLNGALSVDGNNPTVGQIVLVKNESGSCTSSSGACNNGLYNVTAAGSGIVAFVLTRNSNYNSSSNVIPGIVTYVISGATLADDFWAMTSASPITIGVTSLNYTEVSGGGSSISSLGPLGQLQTGATQTLATSSDTNLGLTITASGNVQTFTTNWLGTLSTTRGGLGGNFNASTGALSINSGTVSAGTLSIANGGTNATSFTTSGNGVYWNGTSLLTAPLTSAVTYPFASTTALTASSELVIPNGTTKGSTVAGQLELDTTNDQLKVGDGVAIAVFDQRRFLTFTYATTTAWTGTTTLLSLGTAPTGLTLQNVQCYTDTGTLNVQYQYATGPTFPAMLNASTTIGTFTWTGNNAPATGNTIGVKVGTPASSPTQISCTITAVVVGT